MGLIKGEKQKEADVVKNMLTRGFEDDDIIKIVNISPQTLAQLKNQK